MSERLHRRMFLGAATAGVLTGPQLVGHSWAVTPKSGDLGDYKQIVSTASGQSTLSIPKPDVRGPEQATEDNILGPYYRPQVPYRAKVTPPLEPGEPLVVWGRVWGVDTRQPLTRAVIHVWQANSEGRYDNDDPNRPPQPGVFANRARMVVDETGYYEYETIRPGRYKTGPQQWRPAHIHYYVEAPGYKSLITQMYFKGDPENDNDAFIRPSLIMTPEAFETPRGDVQVVRFDVVLEPGKAGDKP